MKPLFLFCLLLIMLSCSSNSERQSLTFEEAPKTIEVTQPAFQKILDSAKVYGSILIYDIQKSTFITNDFERCKTGFLPASTFKIPNSIIALETGVIESDSSVFIWDGKKRPLNIWEKDMTLREAFHLSCVPCYQEIARNVGVERMNAFVKKLDYGNMVVDTSNLDVFWLEGASRISPLQEVNFLKRLYFKELPLSERTYQLMKSIMIMEQTPAYTLSGKTGWVIREGLNIGWFVGYVERREGVYFFATNIEPKEGFDMNDFPKIRRLVTFDALKLMDLM